MSKTHFLPAAWRAVFTIVLLALAGVARAQSNFPPERMTYQGFLADGNGNALGTNAPKNYDVIFRIYDAESAGTIRWQEQQTVTVDKGYFSVLLGEGTVTVGGPSISAVFNSTNASERHMQMTVKGIGGGGTDVNILPRLRMLSAPYAFLARHARALVSSNGATLISSTGTNVTVGGPLTATSFSVSGANLTLGTNVALRTNGNTFSGQQNFNNHLQMANATILYGVNSGGNVVECLIPRWSDNATYFNYGTGGLNVRNNAGTTSLFVRDNGNVGIGTGTTPDFPLSFAGTFGDKISLWQSGSNLRYGIAVQSGVIQMMTPTGGSTAFGYGSSTNFTEVMRVFGPSGEGVVGIGTSGLPDTSGKLHIRQKSVAAYNSPVYAILIDNVTNSVGGNYRGGIRFTDDGHMDLTVQAKANNPVAARLNNAGIWSSTSDARVKKDVTPLHDTLERALRLRPVNYHFTNQTSDESLNMGFIAQEVQREFPSLVTPGDMLTLNYSGLGVVAIGAIQELNQQIKSENKSLRETLETKDAELQSVKERLAALEELVKQSLGGAKAAK